MSEQPGTPPTYEPQPDDDPPGDDSRNDGRFDPQSLPNTPAERQEQNAGTSLIEPSDDSS